MAPASIRIRLTAGYGILMMITLLGLGGTAYELLSNALIERVDEGLDFELREAQERLLAGFPVEDMAREPETFHETYFLRILTSSGHVLAQSRKLDGQSIPLPSDSRNGQASHHGSMSLGKLGPCRVLTAEFRKGSELLLIQIATSLAVYESQLADMRKTLWTILPAGFLAATCGGYWLAGRSLVPVQRMAESARRISAANLSDRLSVSNPCDELGHLATTLNAMLDRIDRAFSSSRRFTADAAHELKTPVAAIRTEAEVSLISGRSPEEYQKTLRSIVEEAQRLARLTERLLLLSREDTGQNFLYRAVRLDETIQEAVEHVDEMASQAGLVLRIERLPAVHVEGEPDLLRQVYENLLDNAIKYTPQGGLVTVRGHCVDGRVVVEVSDTGIGIPDHALPCVFDRFYRVDPSRSRRSGGTGLGLSIARAVVERHGGTIDVASTPGSGSTFRTVLPIAGKGT